MQAILAGSMVKGTRPRRWDPALIEPLLAQRKGLPEDSLWNLYGYYYAMDCGQIDRADQYLGLAFANEKVIRSNRELPCFSKEPISTLVSALIYWPLLSGMPNRRRATPRNKHTAVPKLRFFGKWEN